MREQESAIADALSLPNLKVGVSRAKLMILLSRDVKIQPLLKELDCHPELWNRYDLRTRTYPDSPHREVDDIWLRYRDYSELNPDTPHEFANDPNAAYNHWYCAAYELPQTVAMIDFIFEMVNGAELGGCLITRIPPGKCVYPHSDAGSFHAEYFKDKYLLLLKSSPKQTFEFIETEESYSGEAGSLWKFDNAPIHAVYNNSDVERISLLMAVKPDV